MSVVHLPFILDSSRSSKAGDGPKPADGLPDERTMNFQ